MACVAVASLVRTIELELLQPQPRPLVRKNELNSYNKKMIESLHEKLGSLIQQFDDNRFEDVEAVKHLETKFRDLAFRVEDEIEFLVADLYEYKTPFSQRSRQICQLRLRQILRQAIEDTDAIKEEFVKIKNEYAHVADLQGRNNEPISNEVIPMGGSSQHASYSEEIMVGKTNEFKTIKEMLMEHPSKQREVVSIKGMGGIGKTTLARRVFEDSSIVSHFDKRAWVVSSQFHNKKQMLVGLLNSIFQQADAESSNDEDLALKLYQCLKGQRYLAIIDDVWSRGAWDDVKACFPDDKNGSRVLLTTRLEEVASYTSFNTDFSHQMHLLNESESWNLFCEKIDKSHSVKFETIARPVVEKCKGLPLAIVVVAGLYSKLNTVDEWKNITRSLNSSATISSDETCSRILSLSYNHMPHNLRSCFLYLGVFPEDFEIKAKDLSRLWAAEGLVTATQIESLETVAEKNIQQLVDRNLILISRQSCCGRKIKMLKMHDLLHAFCVGKAQNENLLHVADENGSNFESFRWVRIESSTFNIHKLHSLPKKCRSIFCFLFGKEHSILNLEKFNQLRVFYTTYTAHVHCKIVDLVHLRYISHLEVDGISKLKRFRAWNLQTLSISDSNCFTADGMPYHIWVLPQLRYLHSENMCRHPPKFVRQNLQSISELHSWWCKKEFFANIAYLKDVCFGGLEWGDIENFACLQQLERLKIIYGSSWHSLTSISNKIILFKNIKRLSLSNTSLQWKEVDIFSKLPRLEVLKLNMNACIGQEWELTEETEFQHLLYLGIFLGFVDTDLKQWKASKENFPKLEHLLLNYCTGLEEIPSGFGEIPSLKSIKLVSCLPSLVGSAKQIQEEQHEYGNSNMVVIEENTRRTDIHW